MREVGVGDKLDQYELTDVIARSGMASVFKAADTLNGGATVVIKVPYLQFESDVIFYGRFQREEEIGQRLDHPHIVKVLKPAHKSRMYIAMEYVQGTSLRELMQGGRPLAAERALEFARQIGETLVYMHGQGVVHRDLKPENILIVDGDQIKIMDFGIALDQAARRMTISGMSSALGTPDYMAPEQVSGRRGDARTDIYCFGVILYEMFTGGLPYSGPNYYAVMRAKGSEDPQPPHEFNPEIDPKIEEIILHAIERNPRNRYPGATALLDDLRDPSKVELSGRAARLHPRSLRVQRLRRTAMMGLFFASIAGVFVFLIWLANRYPAAPPARTPHSYRGHFK